MIKDDTLIFQFSRLTHRLTNDVFYFTLGEQGPELQAGATLTSSGPPHPRKSVSRLQTYESKIKYYLYRGKQGRPRARIRDRACLWLQSCRLPVESVSVHLEKNLTLTLREICVDGTPLRAKLCTWLPPWVSSWIQPLVNSPSMVVKELKWVLSTRTKTSPSTEMISCPSTSALIEPQS